MTATHGPGFQRQKTSSSTATATATAMPAAESHWADLPDELLGLILQKLTVQDHVRFGCVCVRWNLAAGVGGRGGLRPGRPRPAPQLPWLMVPAAGRDRTSAKFISPSERRTYNIPLPHPPICERICVGSSHGWLITLHKFLDMHLLNPITGVQVPLPPIDSFAAPVSGPMPFSFFYGKAILSSAPSGDGTGDYTIFFLHNLPLNPRTLAITRVGDEAWTMLASEGMTDIIYHNGQLLCVGVAESIHILEQQQHRLSLVPGFFHRDDDDDKPLSFTHAGTKLLVQSPTGELFMLLRTPDAAVPNSRTKTTRFEIIRLDLERHEHVTVDDLDDDAFFVGSNDSIVLSPAEFPEVRRNCVYFTDNDYFRRPWQDVMTMARPRNMGVFDVEKEEVAELLDVIGSHLSRKEEEHIGLLMNWPPPTWVIPTLF